MLTNRPPVVAILGHVDHGKTTLLDKIRATSVAAREAGGITQHIGAYQILLPDSGFQITFVDTPGHAAFSKMRSRGGQVADIAILVVATNDGVMPQTKEAIEIIKKANLPLIVAASKMDLPDTSLDRLKGQLAGEGIVPEDYGGDVPVIPVSGKTGEGIKNLLETIALINELHPTQSDPEAPFEGLVIESSMNHSTGPRATIIVKSGTLKIGDVVFAKNVRAKIKSMTGSNGQSQNLALPSTPVEVTGFEAVPPVGCLISTSKEISLSPVPDSNRPEGKPASDLKIILKADVVGSLETLTNTLSAQSGLEIVDAATGDISESDVLSARATSAQILGFGTKISPSVAKLAETENVNVKTYRIIYELLDDLDKKLNLIRHPELRFQSLGRATVKAIFEMKGEKIAGCKLEEGKISRADLVHIERNSATIGQAKIKSLRTGKEDALEVKKGDEFGAVLTPPFDFAIGDAIIAYRELPEP